MLPARDLIAVVSSLLCLLPSLAFAESLNSEPEPAEPAHEVAAGDDATIETVVITGAEQRPTNTPTAQTAVSIAREQFRNGPGLSIAEVMALSPGVTFVQGNGPRDVSISVRGSNNRQTFGVRNIKVFEDGFPVTQPDGLARTDLTDPHAYGRIDVVQGPSSAYYGNYATGGAVNFTTRAGGDIRGIEAGLDAGSYDYLNLYTSIGDQGERYEYAAFVSNVRGESKTDHTGYITSTANVLASFQATPRDRITFKFINNDLDADLAIRLSLNQFRTNPYQHNCADLAGAACASVSLYSNGFNGSRQSLSPQQAGLERNDRRTIVAARWEHDLDAQNSTRTQLVFDNRDIKQPTSATAALGTYPSFNFSSDLLHRGELSGHDALTLVGVFYNYENLNGYSYNLSPAGNATLGAQTQTTAGRHQNAGLRLRQELALTPQWTAVAGLGAEFTALTALNTAYAYPTSGTPTTTAVEARRNFYNFAPELALQYQPSPAWKLHARVASGYGTPQVGNLFVTSQGIAGNNTDLKSQRNDGFDVGADWVLAPTLTASVAGFYEFFRNELVTQSPGAALLSYTFNAPRSEHRGVELALDWHPLAALLPGAHIAAAYLYDDQIYSDYSERLSAGSQSTAFERDGNKIPGIQPQYLNARLIYDQPAGPLQGLGAYVELNYRESFYLDNANLLKAPSYTLVNLNLHYQPAMAQGIGSRLSIHFSIQNLFDKTYVGSASNISDSIDSGSGTQNGVSTLEAATGSIYAGSPRVFYGGFSWKF